MKLRNFLLRHWATLSFVGLVFATLLFSASLTPSLIPRKPIVQGLLSGSALAMGYGIGVFFVWLWRFLELPAPHATLERLAKIITIFGVLIVVVISLWNATVWQNSIRELMGMDPVHRAYPYWVIVVAIAFGRLLIAVWRIIWKGCEYVTNKVNLILPRRISYLVGIALVGTIILVIGNDLIWKRTLIVADDFFSKLDAKIDEEIEQPTEGDVSGSSESLIDWDSIGRQGKGFVVTGPTKDDISEFLNAEALRPIRVYVGYRSRPTPSERASLALEELKRVGGFDRKLLVVATPTGTGWLDPGAVDSIEYLHAGDTAIVSTQYSYLPSWLTLLVDAERSSVSAKLLFDAVYGYWTTLPENDRPKLYLQGLSLGALGSEVSADLVTVFEDPIHGALWSGPPFPNRIWSQVTANRNPGSPAWLPKFRDGSILRFVGQASEQQIAGGRWGAMRMVYIQYASDPMTFFSPKLVFQKPDWLIGQRGPDVSPYLRWYPILTSLMIGFDLPLATTVPIGHGHNIAPANYIDGWIAVSEPSPWSQTNTKRLKQRFLNQTRGD